MMDNLKSVEIISALINSYIKKNPLWNLKYFASRAVTTSSLSQELSLAITTEHINNTCNNLRSISCTTSIQTNEKFN